MYVHRALSVTSFRFARGKASTPTTPTIPNVSSSAGGSSSDAHQPKSAEVKKPPTPEELMAEKQRAQFEEKVKAAVIAAKKSHGVWERPQRELKFCHEDAETHKNTKGTVFGMKCSGAGRSGRFIRGAWVWRLTASG